MDDFGTGYASLRYLRDHPFTSLKIDRGFIRDLDSQPRNRQLVVSALRLGQALGMKVVAEGVETEAELAVLAEAGCELVQGFLFSRPVDADRIAALLADGNAGE
jgi:EAL domain-containing protein (putative c-di-GMP-specific phosphodiesterase class I)